MISDSAEIKNEWELHVVDYDGKFGRTVGRKSTWKNESKAEIVIAYKKWEPNGFNEIKIRL